MADIGDTRTFDPKLADAINATAQQGLTREGLLKAGMNPDKTDPHDPHAAAMVVLTSNGMSPVDANTWWSYQPRGIRKERAGKLVEHKSLIDNPWIKAAVLAPMIIGGGFAVAGAIGAGGTCRRHHR